MKYTEIDQNRIIILQKPAILEHYIRLFQPTDFADGKTTIWALISDRWLQILRTYRLIQFLLDYFFITDSSTTQLIRILNTIFFIIGAIAMGAGLYLIINSLLRVRPHTTLIFVRFKGKDLRVTFRERNAPKALRLKEVFMKQQRLLKL